jgi:hypothetical protein
VIQGFDIDGTTDYVEYKIDTASTWTEVAADPSSGNATFDVLNLPLGANTLLFARLTIPAVSIRLRRR